MITFSRFGRHGNLGNQLFQWASLAAMCKKFGKSLVMPKWKYSEYFVSPPDVGTLGKSTQLVQEKHFHYDIDQWSKLSKSSFGGDIDVLGWLQSEKYWDCDQDFIKKLMTFRADYVNSIRSKYKVFYNKHEIIAISVRRGDYVGNPNYKQLDIGYYLSALLTHFPEYHKKYNLMIFSDDMDYCRLQFSGLKNVTFSNTGAIEQLIAMSQCHHFIIANSTFSWWGAYLGMKPGSKVIRPDGLFAGDMMVTHDAKDFYPESWIEHAQKKIDLEDVTFTIPYKRDHADRQANLELSVQMLDLHFNTNIIVRESSDQVFHRTRLLNEMALESKTPIIVNWDTDVIIPPAQIIESVRRIRDNEVDMIYPYDGRFARVTRDNFNLVKKSMDIGVLAGKTFKGMNPGDRLSVGGAIMFNKEKFISGGMENENFISYGPEDLERLDRFEMMGLRTSRAKGVLYHMDHFIGPDSNSTNPYFKSNEQEYKRIARMNADDLKREVQSWKWVPKYSADYYETIFENAIKSRDEIFKVLIDLGFLKPGMKVLDVGCGIGEFGFEAKEKYAIDYYGVDYRTPREKLLIENHKYAEYDLMSGSEFPWMGKFDLVICTEVLEHIDEKYAESAVQLLTKLSDTILFSAAVPGQGGHHHVNEQWQTYWAAIFAVNGFCGNQSLMISMFWNNENVDVWYRQNLVLYTKYELDSSDTNVMAVVHPVMFENVIKTLKSQNGKA